MSNLVKFTGIVELGLEPSNSGKSSKLIETKIRLEFDNNIDANAYQYNNGIPTKEGAKALTNCFIQGLIGNIHASHERKYRDSAEHLRYIISELERGFATPMAVTDALM